MEAEVTPPEGELRRYPLTEAQEARIVHDFGDHTPTSDQSNRDSQIRHAAREFMRLIFELTPPSREQSLALTHLQEVVSWSYQAMESNE